MRWKNTHPPTNSHRHLNFLRRLFAEHVAIQNQHLLPRQRLARTRNPLPESRRKHFLIHVKTDCFPFRYKHKEAEAFGKLSNLFLFKSKHYQRQTDPNDNSSLLLRHGFCLGRRHDLGPLEPQIWLIRSPSELALLGCGLAFLGWKLEEFSEPRGAEGENISKSTNISEAYNGVARRPGNTFGSKIPKSACKPWVGRARRMDGAIKC